MVQNLPTLGRWIFVVITAALLSTQTWAAGSEVAFNIPAGPATATLRTFYLQSHVRVLYLSDALKGIETQAVIGEFAAPDALAKLLEGTGLTFDLEGDSAVISAVPAIPLAAKAVMPGDAPHVPPAVDTDAETKLQEVLVLGSLIHGVFDITSPLTTMERREITRVGYATIQDVVRSLPIAANITRGEVLAGTGNFGRGSSINLRGLGDGATLVLVNGRRQPVAGTQGDFVDVSTIPWSMVDHIDVLPDGGSALYGSDAIAGVVNIVMRPKVERAETLLRYATTEDGATELVLAQILGHNWDSGHWLAGYQYSDRTSLAAAERSYAANSDKRELGGTDFRRIYSNPGNILDPSTLQPLFAIPSGQDGRSLAPGDLLPGMVNYQNQFADVELWPKVRTHNVYFAASQNLSEHVELFAEGRYSQRDFSQRPWTPSPVTQGALVVPAANPFFVDPFASSPFVIVAYDFARDLGPYATRGRTKNYSFTLGLQPEFNNTWRASLAAAYGRESLDVADHGQINMSRVLAVLDDPNSATAFNPFGDGSHTDPTTLASIELPMQYNAISALPSFQVQADGRLFDLPTGSVKAAIGAEYREESWSADIRTTAPHAARSFLHARLGRTVAAAFAELSVPLIGDAADRHGVPRLELSLAGRYEHYNDFGDTFNPKVGARWMPLRSLKFRTSWGTSFRAPNLIDLYDASNSAFMLSVRDQRSPTGRSNVLAIAGGNPDLKEELATTWTVGFDLAPQVLPGFELSLTGYSIDYKGQVIQPGPASNPADVLLQEDQWASVVIRDPSQSQIDAVCSSSRSVPDVARCRQSSPAAIFDARKHNLANTKVTGLDLSVSQVLDTDVGRFKVSLNGAYVFHFQRAFTDTAPVVDSVNTVNNTLALRARGIVEWQPHGEHEAGFAATLAANYTGDYKDPDSSVQRTVDSWTTFDLGIRYLTKKRGDWTDDTELTLNVLNVLNEDPPFVDREWGYDIVNAQPTDRAISAYLSKRW